MRVCLARQVDYCYWKMMDGARHFLKISKLDADDGGFDISLFHLEQAMQLALKAYLLRGKGISQEPMEFMT